MIVVHNLNMDPLAMASEIVTLLQAAADAAPSAKHRREPNEKRQEAYYSFQHEAYRLMSGVNHLNTYTQVKPITWKTGAVAALPMVGTFLDFLQPELATFLRSKKPGRYAYLRDLEKRLPMAAALTRANTPMAAVSFADALAADTVLMYRVTGDMSAIRDTTADFMTALAKVRLVGRPGPVAAADVIRAALQELFARISAKEKRFHLATRGQSADQKRSDFDTYLSVLAEANEQFLNAVRADRPVRHYRWQFWRPTQLPAKLVPELLAKVRGQ